MNTPRFDWTKFSCGVLLVSSLVGACGGDKNNQVNPDAASQVDASPDAAIPLTPVADLLATIPAGTAWADVPVAVQTELKANADADLAAYRAKWGHAGLATKEATLLGTPDAATLANFDAYVSGAFATEVPSTFNAHTDITNADLLSAFKKLYLNYFATRRVAVGYLGDFKDWDGSDLHEIALPDAQTISDQKAYATTTLTALAAIPASALNATQLALRDKATFYLRQLATASQGFAYGGDDLLTTYGIAAWAADLPYRYNDAGGKIFTDDKAFAQLTNAFFFGTLTRVNVGTVHSLDYVLSGSVDPDYVKSLIGDPATSAASKDFSLLGTWFGQRITSHPDAAKLCTLYSAADRDAIWNSFTADSLADNERATSFDSFNTSYAAAKNAVLVKNRALTVAGIMNVFPSGSTVLPTAKRTLVIAAVNAETKAGSTLDTAYAKMDLVLGTTAASDLFKATMAALTTIGGYADTTTAVSAADISAVNAMWTQIKTYLTAHYSGHTNNLATLVPATLVIQNTGNGIATAPDGNITVDLNSAIDKASLYSTLMHEAKHAIDAHLQYPVEGAALEGSAETIQERVVPLFLTSVMGSDPQLPLYELTSGLADTRVGATTDAMLQIYLRTSCNAGEPDSFTFAENVVASWGLPTAQLALRSDRAHFGTQYLGYDYGRIATDTVLDYVKAQLASTSTTPIDPYLFQACGVPSPRANTATVNAIKTCLGL